MFVIVYLDDILIYIKNLGQGHIKCMRWVLDVLKRHEFFINLKNCQFYKNEVCFLGYVILAQGVRMEDKQIKMVKNYL